MVPLFLNGVDNFQAGARQLWTGETTNTLLHTGTKAGAEALGASEQNAERIATAVDISTIFLGGGSLFKTVKALKAPSNASRVAEIAKANNIYFQNIVECISIGFLRDCVKALQTLLRL